MAWIIKSAAQQAELASGFIGEPYSESMKSGCPVDRWWIESGSLPPGLGFTSDGNISGTPIEAGTWTFTVGAEKTLEVTDINPAGGTLTEFAGLRLTILLK